MRPTIFFVKTVEIAFLLNPEQQLVAVHRASTAIYVKSLHVMTLTVTVEHVIWLTMIRSALVYMDILEITAKKRLAKIIIVNTDIVLSGEQAMSVFVILDMKVNIATKQNPVY